MKVLHRIVSIIALLCCFSSGFSEDSKKRFLGDGSELDTLFKEDCIHCFCSQNCPGGDLIKGECQVFTNTTDCSHDQCEANTCSGHGTCHAVNNEGRLCACTDGYTGKTCDRNELTDNCAKNPCQDGQCSSTDNGYYCTCDVGWRGTTCDAVDNCSNSPCINGQCSNTASGYYCTCNAGWNGTNCDTSIKQCQSSPCKNNGTCLDLGGVLSCVCGAEWSGPTCEKDATPSCNHVCVIEPVATVHSVFNDSALKCNDSHRGSNEAMPMTCCGIRQENTWHKGMQVIAHCSEASTLPIYTPIASFQSGRPANDTSGVIVACDANGFKDHVVEPHDY